MTNPDIYSFIKEQESRYETETITVGDNWDFNMRNHIQLIFHLRNGVFFTGSNDITTAMRAFKEIMDPMIELANWTEDLEVKDTTFYIEGKDDKAMSFLIKKYHDEVYSRENNLDTLYDEITESDNTYGGTLVQRGKKIPEVIKLKCISFCDQSDILGGAVGFEFNFSPDKLRSMAKLGWGDEKNGATISIDELCVLAEAIKEPAGNMGKENNATGKNIKVTIVRGSLPEHYLEDNDNMEYYCDQLQIVAFYTNQENQKQGVTLYRKKADESDLKFFTSNEVEDRALGRGVGERLVHPQIWTNFLTIHKLNMLEAGSKVPLYTDDPSYTTKNKIQDMENLEITTIEDGKKIYQVPTVAPANIQLFEKSIDDWYLTAQNNASAFDPLMGKEESSGTTFRGQERLVAQGRGPHDRKRGKRAKFIEELYRGIIIPDMVKEITKGKKFLATLSTDEMSWVADQMATKSVNDRIKEMILNGKIVTKEEQDMMMQTFKQDFYKKGNKKLLEIVKDELKDAEIRMGINIAGKQKNLANVSDKILSIFQFIIGNPQGFQVAMQNPALAKAFEDILEYSGLSIANFSTLVQQAQPILSPMQPTPSPMQPQNMAQQSPKLALTNANE